MIIFKSNIITSRNKLIRLVKGMEGNNRERQTMSSKKSKHAKTLASEKLVQDYHGSDTGIWNPVQPLQNANYQESIRLNQGNFNAAFSQFTYPPVAFLASAYEKSVQQRNFSMQPNNLSGMSFNRDKSGSSSSQQSKTKMFEKLGGATRIWEDVSGDNLGADGITFKLMSYNILAQDLVDQHMNLYNMHDKRDLPWPKRLERLLSEIKFHKADILCLQEVQLTHLDEIKSRFKKLGYEGLYKKRTGNCPDGCAIYYKPKVFKLIDDITVEYFQPQSFLLDRDNVGIIAKFAPANKPNAEFVVATTHLLYNPRRADVRVAQLQLFLTEIERMSYKITENTNYLPIIMTGDLNSQPRSEVVNFVQNAIIDNSNLAMLHTKTSNLMDSNGWIPSNLGVADSCQHIEVIRNRSTPPSQRESKINAKLVHLHHSDRDNKEWGNNQNVNNEYFNRGFLSHTFNFKSAYQHGYDDNPEGTTFQHEWITVDYIFYSVTNNGQQLKSDDKMHLLRRYTLPKRNQLNHMRIPNKYLGSDHLSLMAQFKLNF